MIEVEAFTVAQARKSTLVVAGVLTAMAAWQVYRGRPTAVLIMGGLVVVLLVCAAIPVAATFFHKWWMTLAGVLGYVNSRIILSALFFLIMTPVGVVVRLVGHDPLTRRQGKQASYWHRRAATRQSREGYERSF